MKDATELPGAEASRLRQFLDCQRTMEVLLGVSRAPTGRDPISVQVRAKPRTATALRPTMVEDELPGDRLRNLRTEVGFDQSERQVDAGAHARRGPDRAVVDEDTVLVDRAIRKLLLQLSRVHPMRRDTPSVEQSRFSKDEGAGADRGDAPSRFDAR